MYKLYWCPRTASQSPMAVLEEIGADYELEPVDMEAGQHRSPEYLQINPNGLVPTLITQDGVALCESVAILLYLGDRHSEAKLAPEPLDPLRPAYLQWMAFMAGTLFPAYKRFFYSHRYSTDESDADKVKARAVESLLTEWKTLDDALDGRAWVLGGRVSVCDIYMQMFSSWFREPDDLYSRFTNIARICAATAARPAVARAMKKHGR